MSSIEEVKGSSKKVSEKAGSGLSEAAKRVGDKVKEGKHEWKTNKKLRERVLLGAGGVLGLVIAAVSGYYLYKSGKTGTKSVAEKTEDAKQAVRKSIK